MTVTDTSKDNSTDRVDGQKVATPQEVAKALELVTSACKDLHVAYDGLMKIGGLVGVVKESFSGSSAPSASASTSAAAPETQEPLIPPPAGADAPAQKPSKAVEVLKTLGHDGRVDAAKLIAQAHDKYEEAADLVDGLPDVGIAEAYAPALGKMVAQHGEAAKISLELSLLVLRVAAFPFGIAISVFKRKRAKRAAGNVQEMITVYEAVRQALEALDQQGRGGMVTGLATLLAAQPGPVPPLTDGVATGIPVSPK